MKKIDELRKKMKDAIIADYKDRVKNNKQSILYHLQEIKNHKKWIAFYTKKLKTVNTEKDKKYIKAVIEQAKKYIRSEEVEINMAKKALKENQKVLNYWKKK